MRTRPRFWSHFTTFAALGAAALFGTAAQAADLGPQPLPPLSTPVESWTGFSFAVGGGLGILTADVNGRASRDDAFGTCPGTSGTDCPNGFAPFPDAFISQSHQLNVHELSDDGLFGTIQLAYDWQVAPQWVWGLFIDADLYDIDGHAKQRSSVATDGLEFSRIGVNSNFDFTLGNATLDAEVGLDWSLTLGTRFGWLARPDTLLYVLGGWTHAELQNTRFMVNITDPAVPTVASGLSPIDTQYLLNLASEVDGATVGAGTEVRLGSGWSLKGEYRFTWLNGEGKRASNQDLQCCVSGDVAREVRSDATVNMDLDIHTVRGMLAYRF